MRQFKSKTLNFSIVFLLLCSVGCASYRSTIMSRLPNDRLRRNSDQCVKGIPVTVKIPTHVDVTINEEYFIAQGAPADKDGDLDKAIIVTQIPNLGKPLRTVSLVTVYTPKVLTTNFVRPAAGTLAIGNNDSDGITLDPDNYFATIQATIDDQTLKDITAAIPNLKTAFGLKNPLASKVAAGGEATELSGCESFNSVIAFKRFDINIPGWEEELQAFVEQHISCQQQPCGPEPGACYSDEQLTN